MIFSQSGSQSHFQLFYMKATYVFKKSRCFLFWLWFASGNTALTQQKVNKLEFQTIGRPNRPVDFGFFRGPGGGRILPPLCIPMPWPLIQKHTMALASFDWWNSCQNKHAWFAEGIHCVCGASIIMPPPSPWPYSLEVATCLQARMKNSPFFYSAIVFKGVFDSTNRDFKMKSVSVGYHPKDFDTVGGSSLILLRKTSDHWHRPWPLINANSPPSSN